MNYFIYLFISGAAFFLGTGLLLVGFCLPRPRGKRTVRIKVLLISIGTILVVFSAIPMPFWLYAAWGVLLLLALIVERQSRSLRWLWLAKGIAVASCLGAAAIELPWHWVREAPIRPSETLFVIGDSVSAGLGSDSSDCWPAMLQNHWQLQVKNLAAAGATTASAITQAREVHGDGTVLIEIGGNELLSGQSASQFEIDLEALLRELVRPGRQIVMMELPLPPFENRFGLVQRRLAVKYGVKLVPRRIFAYILTAPGATLDSVHLSQKGHNLFASQMCEVFGCRGLSIRNTPSEDTR